MNRDLIIGVFVAVLLHAGLALGGDFFKSRPAVKPVDDTIPVIELAPLPPAEPETVELSDPAAEAGGDLSDIVPPMQADTPAPTASTFSQQFQPLPPPGINRSIGMPIIPTRIGAGVGGGTGSGFKNLFDLANLDQKPSPRSPLRPVYPLEMSRAGINGQVVVGFMVDSDGNAQNAFVIRSSNREFEAEALRVVTRAKFTPGRKGGVNVNTRNVTLTISFTITDK
jgi:periplasmic protein TonB